MSTITLEPEVSAEPVVVVAKDPSMEELLTSGAFSVSPQPVDAIPIVMYSSHVEIEITKGVKKSISHEEFKALITRTETQAAEESVEGIHLPSNSFFFSQSNGKLYISCYYTGGVRKFKYMDQSMEIMVPNIIISHVMRRDKKDWLIETTKFFCTDVPISKLPRKFINEINQPARVFLLPMSNTYEDGKMCYGSNNMPVRFVDNNIRGVDYYYSFLWDTPFNNDLGIRATRVDYVSTWYDYLKRVAEAKEPFPYSHLRGWSANEYSSESKVVLR